MTNKLGVTKDEKPATRTDVRGNGPAAPYWMLATP